MTPTLPPHNPPSATFVLAGVHALEPSEEAAALRRRFPTFMMFGDNAHQLTARTPWLGFGLNQCVAKTTIVRDDAVVISGEKATNPA